MPTTETINAVLGTRQEFPEAVFHVEPGPNRRGSAVIYVSGFAPDTEASDEVRARMIQTVQQSTGQSFSGVYWMVRDPETSMAWRCTGYPLDEQPVNDAHYRTLQGLLVRYNDDDHMDRRHQPGLPYSILASREGPWPLPKDGLYPSEETDYPPMVRVVYEGDDNEASGDRQPEPGYIEDISPTGVTRGLAQPEANGRVLKSPAPESGEMYLLWDASETTPAVNVVTYNGTNEDSDEPVFTPLGFIGVSGPELHSSASMYIQTENMVWVKAMLAVPSPTDEQLSASAATAPALRTELNTELEKWESFGQALNYIAEEHGWCEQFDDIIRDLGFEGRAKDWWVEVEADLTIEDSNPSSRMDDRLESEYGVTISASSVEVRGKVTIRVNSISAPNSDEAQNSIDSTSVEEALDEVISGGTYTLHDWEVTDSGQED
jgi:hypothetical protein